MRPYWLWSISLGIFGTKFLAIVVNIIVCASPAVASITLISFSSIIGFGNGEFVKEPCPNCPEVPVPHVQQSPSYVTQPTWAPPAKRDIGVPIIPVIWIFCEESFPKISYIRPS